MDLVANQASGVLYCYKLYNQHPLPKYMFDNTSLHHFLSNNMLY